MGLNIGAASNQIMVKAQENRGVGKTTEDKLSDKAKELLDKLKDKYQDCDFFVGNSAADLKALSKSANKEFSVMFSSEELEKMASDEKYAEEKLKGMEDAISMSKKISEREGYLTDTGIVNSENGVVNKISFFVDDNGTTRMFAELEKTTQAQKERIEEAKEEKKAARKAEAKKAEDKKAEARKAEKKAGKPDAEVNKVEEKKPESEKVIIEASSIEELVEKINNFDWNSYQNTKVGEKVDYSV